MFKKTWCMMGLAALVAPAFAAEWMTDLEAAKTKAAAENKAVLVDFTGSDWCSWCIKLRQKVFDTKAFEDYAKDKFVLVEIDVPRRKDFSPELLKKNEELCAQYDVTGFPTVMVMTPQGEFAGGFVGGLTEMSDVTKALDTALGNVETLEQASKAQGVEKAKLLIKVYNNAPKDFEKQTKELAQQIGDLDPGDATGIQKALLAKRQMEELTSKLGEASRNHADVDTLLSILNEAMENAAPENVEKITAFKGQILSFKLFELSQQADSLEDVAKIKAILEELIGCLPQDKQKAAREELEKQFADPEAVLKQLRSDRQKEEAGASQK